MTAQLDPPCPECTSRTLVVPRIGGGEWFWHCLRRTWASRSYTGEPGTVEPDGD